MDASLIDDVAFAVVITPSDVMRCGSVEGAFALSILRRWYLGGQPVTIHERQITFTFTLAEARQVWGLSLEGIARCVSVLALCDMEPQIERAPDVIRIRIALGGVAPLQGAA